MAIKLNRSENLRSLVFGVEDSIVSTIGLVSGIAVAGVAQSIVILTGVVLVFVEAFSMAVGELLSDNSVREFKQHSDVSFKNSAVSAAVMFFSYLLSGMIVLSPYIFLEGTRALTLSIVLSLLALFVLGLGSSHFAGTHPVKKGFIMVAIGGMAIFIGVLVGRFLKN